MYAVIDAILVRALPYPQSERLVTSFNSFPGLGLDRLGVSLVSYYDRRDALKSFESVSILRDSMAVVGESSSVQRLLDSRVSPEFFDTLNVPVMMGRRNFTEEETLPGNALVTIITHSFWQEQFNSDPDVIGKSLRIDGRPHVVVGVLERGFEFPWGDANFFRPIASSLEDRQPEGRYTGNDFTMIGRLRQGVSVESAQKELDSHNELLMKEMPESLVEILKNARYGSYVRNLHEDIVRQARPILIILQAGALFLLLIAIVNLMNLFLIRAKSRAKETAVRQSHGAGRLQIAKEVGIETFMLTFAGGGIGLALGVLCIHFLEALGTDQLPLGNNISLDGRVVWVSFICAICVGVILSLPIIVSSYSHNLSSVLKAGARGGTGSKSQQKARHVFVVTQVALAFALLSGAGMLGLSLKKTLETSPGFETEEVVVANIGLPSVKYPRSHHRQAFLDRLNEDLRTIPGVEHVGFTNAMPFNWRPDDFTIRVVGRTLAPGETDVSHYFGFASGDYWRALGIPLIEGRFLEERDNKGDVRVCVVDESVARRYWPDQSAIGRQIAWGDETNPATIVGVVGTVKTLDLTELTPLGTVLVPYKLRPTAGIALAVRSKIDPEILMKSIRDTVRSIDPEIPLDRAGILQERIDDSLVMQRSPAVLSIAFASIALILAAIGTYSVIAYAVSQRRREIGIRIALGALPSTILKQFFGTSTWLLLAGIAFGLVGAWFAGVGMKSVLFGVAPFHPGILLATVGIMAFVVLIAVFFPSNRAARLDPLESMREE